MKKIILIIAVIAIVLITWMLIGSNGNTGTTNQSASLAGAVNGGDKIVALSTFTIIADMVAEVGGDRVDSVSLTKIGSEIHGYETTPSDLVAASKADIFFENGMNLELWASKLRSNLPDTPAYVVSEGVEVLSIAEGDYEGKPNPHAWMSPKQGLVYIENIRQALTEFSPADADYFSQNAQDYSEKLMVVDEKLSTALEALPENNRALVTCEGAFTYLTNDYGLQEVYLWAINDESGGSPQQIAQVIDTVRANQIPAVFCESTVEPRIQAEVMAATGAEFGGTLYVDSLSLDNGPAPTYLALLEGTVDTIINGLTQ